jgi:DNA invertase Pin-like site-specific DNA recombinase
VWAKIIQLVDRLIRQRVQLVAIKENIELNSNQDIQTKVMITMFGLFAEIERDLISERTKEGLTAARAKGCLPGRPKGVLGTSKLTGREGEIQSLLAKTGLESVDRDNYGRLPVYPAPFHPVQTSELSWREARISRTVQARDVRRIEKC